jgi:hypothetical protein
LPPWLVLVSGRLGRLSSSGFSPVVQLGMATERNDDDPSPEEIRRACLALQATWSPLQEYRRRVAHLEYGRSPIQRVPPYEFPRVSVTP